MRALGCWWNSVCYLHTIHFIVGCLYVVLTPRECGTAMKQMSKSHKDPKCTCHTTICVHIVWVTIPYSHTIAIVYGVTFDSEPGCLCICVRSSIWHCVCVCIWCDCGACVHPSIQRMCSTASHSPQVYNNAWNMCLNEHTMEFRSQTLVFPPISLWISYIQYDAIQQCVSLVSWLG